MKSQKYADFCPKSGRLGVQLEDVPFSKLKKISMAVKNKKLERKLEIKAFPRRSMLTNDFLILLLIKAQLKKNNHSFQKERLE